MKATRFRSHYRALGHRMLVVGLVAGASLVAAPASGAMAAPGSPGAGALKLTKCGELKEEVRFSDIGLKGLAKTVRQLFEDRHGIQDSIQGLQAELALAENPDEAAYLQSLIDQLTRLKEDVRKNIARFRRDWRELKPAVLTSLDRVERKLRKGKHDCSDSAKSRIRGQVDRIRDEVEEVDAAFEG